jgi:hypothetical protein
MKQNFLVDMVLSTTTANWAALVIHTNDVSQIRDALVAAGGQMVTAKDGSREPFTAVLMSKTRGFLIGGNDNVPRHSIALIATGDTLEQVCERTVVGLDRLAAGMDRLAPDRRN